MTAARLEAAGGPPPAAQCLPSLRGDLELTLVCESGRDLPTLLVRDPVRSTFFRIVWPESAVLLAWQQAATSETLQALLARNYALEFTAEQIAPIIEFAALNELIEASTGWQALAARRRQRQKNPLITLLHGYLFFRIPLLHPQRALETLAPWFGFAFTRAFWFGIAIIGLIGLYLAARDWSAIAAATRDLLAVQTLALYGVAVLMLKAVHEFGHAITTVRQGCRVPSMGLAIMFGAPIFYTDTTDAWRLVSQRQRLAIVMAGVAAETVVAVFALLAWCFLPDGPLRAIAFALATASILLTLTVNLNPFMRFDGYFALSDALGEPNLQPRAFALAKWWLRETLFGLGHTAPEVLPRGRRALLIRYGVATALYRFVLFLGIAALVYVVAGKAIGIVLAAIEIGLLILKPIIGEFAVWWKLRKDIACSARSAVTVSLLALLAGILVMPWVSTVEAPSVIVAAREAPLHLPHPAELRAIHVWDGKSVAAGDILFEARAPELERDLVKARLEERALAARHARLAGTSLEERALGQVITRDLARARASVTAIERQIAQLTVTAPFAGTIRDLDPHLVPGVWLDPRMPVARIADLERAMVRGMVAEAELARIKTGARAVFIPDDPLQPREMLVLERIAPASDGRFAEPVLASMHGGGVLAGIEHGEERTQHGMVEVTFGRLDRPVGVITRGLVWIDAAKVSPLNLLWRQLARVLVREQSF